MHSVPGHALIALTHTVFYLLQSFVNFADFAYGHYNNHNLPIIAWLREAIPETTHFLLHDSELGRAVIQFLDPDLYERVVWIPTNQIVEIRDGSLTVPVLTSYSMTETGDMRPMASLRRWIHDKKGTRPKKHVVFYSRKGANHDRVVAHEEEVLQIIRDIMLELGMEEELVVFTGKHEDGQAMTMEEQYNLFRSAHSIIGTFFSSVKGI